MWTTRAAKFLFKKICGEYFMYELEKDQFKIAFKKGTINLNNLELNTKKINAEIKNVSPLLLTSGYIGNLNTMIPYTSILDTPSEFTISNLELTFVSQSDYNDYVLEKMNEFQFDRSTSTGNNNQNKTSSTTTANNDNYYSDEDEEVDKIQSKNQFGIEGLEALADIFKKLFDKVSARIEKCNITIVQYDKKRNRTITLLFLLDSIEYKSDDDNSSNSNSNIGFDKFNYFLKKLCLKNYSVLISDQYNGNILTLDNFYHTNIFNVISKSNFDIIFSNETSNSNSSNSGNKTTSSPPSSPPLQSSDLIYLKIKKINIGDDKENTINNSNTNTSSPLFYFDCIFQQWNIVLSTRHIVLLERFSQLLFKKEMDMDFPTTKTDKKSPYEKSNDSNNNDSSNSDNINDQQQLYQFKLKWNLLKIFIQDSIDSVSGLQNIQDYINGGSNGPPKRNFILLQLSDINISSTQFKRLEKVIDIDIFKIHLRNHLSSKSSNRVSESINFDIIPSISKSPTNSTSNNNSQLKHSNSNKSLVSSGSFVRSKPSIVVKVVLEPKFCNVSVNINDECLFILDPNLVISLVHLSNQFGKSKQLLAKEEIKMSAKNNSNRLYRKPSLEKFIKQKKQFFGEDHLGEDAESYQEYLYSTHNEFRSGGGGGDRSGGEENYHNNQCYTTTTSNTEDDDYESEDAVLEMKLNNQINKRNLDISSDQEEEEEEESSSMFLSIECPVVKFVLKSPSSAIKDSATFDNGEITMHEKIIEFVITKFKASTNIIQDLPDKKYSFDFEQLTSNLITSGNNSNSFQLLDISTKSPNDVNDDHPIPLEITIRGSKSLNNSNNNELNQQQQQQQDMDDTSSDGHDFQHFNPFSRSEKNKGPFSTFVSISEGIFDTWPDEAEPEEIYHFRHSSIESSKYVFHIIFPYFKVKISKSQYFTVLDLVDYWNHFGNLLLSPSLKEEETQQHYSTPIPVSQPSSNVSTPNSIVSTSTISTPSSSAGKSKRKQKLKYLTPSSTPFSSVIDILPTKHGCSSLNSQSPIPFHTCQDFSISRSDSQTFDEYNLFSLFIVINHGQFIFYEDNGNSKTKNTSSTDPTPPPSQQQSYYQYDLTFERFETFYVSRYYGRDINFISCLVDDINLKEFDLSTPNNNSAKELPKYRTLVNKTIPKDSSIYSDQQILTITVSLNNDKTGFLDDHINNGNIYSLVFKGLTLHYQLGSTWLNRVISFFSRDSDSSDNSDSKKEQEQEQEKEKKKDDNSTNSNNEKYFINFVDSSISYTPVSSKLKSGAVVFFSDIKLKIPDSNTYSFLGQNSYINVIDDLSYAFIPSDKIKNIGSVSEYWNQCGYVSILHLDYVELEIMVSKLLPTLMIDYSHNLLSVNACSDSFYVFNQLMNNLLGLDIPIAEVADLIITQGIGPDLKENIDILINEDTFKLPQQQDQPQQQKTQQYDQQLQQTPTSSSPKIPYSPSPNTVSGTTLNLEFEEFFDDRFGDFSDEEAGGGHESVYEYYSPLDMMSSHSKFSETESNSSVEVIMNEIQDTSSQTSNAPIMGSIMIEDYDHEKLESYPPQIVPPSSTIQEFPHRDFYNDSDILEVPPSLFNTSNNNNNNNNNNNSNNIIETNNVSWIDGANKPIEPIDNYITSPDEDPEDNKLPANYPTSSNRIVFRRMNMSIKIFKGLDWDRSNSSANTTTSASPLTPVLLKKGQSQTPINNSGKQNNQRDQGCYVEISITNCNIRIDRFEEKESYAKRMSLHFSDITIIDHIPTSLWNKFLCSDTNVTRYQESPMVKILLETVRPDPSRPLLQENRLKVLILPIRFNIDQDTVRFIVNFLSYKPPTLASSTSSSTTTSPTITEQPSVINTSSSSISTSTNPSVGGSLSNTGDITLVSPSINSSSSSTVNLNLSSGSLASATTATGGTSPTSLNNSSNSTITTTTNAPAISHSKKASHSTSRAIPEDKAKATDKEAQEMTYFQSVEILPIRMKVDYKPKKVDYHSLTSGNYAELLNLLPLEGALFNLVRLKLTGVGGWSALFNQIGKLWIPHIIQTQLLGYVSGVRGLNSLIHIGEGLANLIILPYEQYKKDGNFIKGLKRGTTTFLKNLTVETLTVGAKVAVGTQNLLETADTVLSSPKSQHFSKSSTKNSTPNFSSPQIQQQHSYIQSLLSNPNYHHLHQQQQHHHQQHHVGSKFSDQPGDTKEGIQHAYESVSREIKSAAHTIIAIPMKEYHQKGITKGYVKSIVQAVPIAIIRPMIGITEGVSKTLLGVRNQIDPARKTEMDNKYKSTKDQPSSSTTTHNKKSI
ncbi:hypothetical protein CYY_002751 [Polysphondylium violaceum]|uniref:Autophagy-related protein 2 n=1 Tax=Polysphondylium violaceum TaxID=133409 RepID=A0A8J4PVU1_9MYCE|nr:hypothetical protein CYY_002751 [Polysphondylium violaceum]